MRASPGPTLQPARPDRGDDVSDDVNIGVGLAGTGVGVVVGLVINLLINAWKSVATTRQALNRERHKDTQAEWESLLDRAKKELDDSRRTYNEDMSRSQRRYEAILTEFRRMERRYERAVSWIEHASAQMVASGVAFLPFKDRPDDDDSGEHRPLAPPPPPAPTQEARP